VTAKTTALFETHRQLGAKLTDFGGWEMPLSYPSGTIAEHLACRRGAAVFDVSHLGTVVVEGSGARDRVQAALTNNIDKVAPGRAQYTHLLDPNDASVIDDIIVVWVAEERFFVMPNASNTENVIGVLGGTDITRNRSVLALQGPSAMGIAASFDPTIAEMKRFRVQEFRFGGEDGHVSTTGYTGEQGVEFSVPNSVAPQLFGELIERGAIPAGLGARDTLRLEAGLPLHGHELGPGITPYEAGLGWVVDLSKPEFRGRDALLHQEQSGRRYSLVGVMASSRQPLRADMELRRPEGELVGRVSSGNFSPMLGVGIGLAFVTSPVAVHDYLEVGQGKNVRRVEVVDLPFVSKAYAKT
jgi:aminomethyltransferase